MVLIDMLREVNYGFDMAPPVTPGQLQITARFSGFALRYPAATTLGALWTPGNDIMTDPALQAELGTAYGDLHGHISANACRLDHLVVKQGPSEIGPSITIPVGRSGTQGNSAQSPNTCLLIRKHVTGVSGRYGGRMYWPVPTEGQVDDGGDVKGALVSQINEALEDFSYLLINELGLTPVILNGTSDPTPISHMTCENRTATQRRRLRR